MTDGPDPRRTPVRAGLAAEARGAAARAAPVRRRVIRPVLDLRAAPDARGLASQLLFGAEVDVHETRGGLAWVQAVADGYVGHVDADGLGEPAAPTHRVAVPLATLYREPDIKTAPLGTLPMNALLAGREEGAFLVAAEGCAHLRHLAPIGTVEADFVAVAERFLHAPYLWGGGTALGLDCSGLVQAALVAAGTPAPRDSDMQEAELGAPLAPDAPPMRGDLIFWRGHVGIMRDPRTLLHANGHHMAVASEPLADARARIAAEYGPPTSRRRL